MYGHNLRRAGRRSSEAIAGVPRRPTRSKRRISRRRRIPAEFDWHYQHNVDLLATSYQYIGQMEKAEALLKAIVRHRIAVPWSRNSTSASGRCSCWRGDGIAKR